MPLSMILFANLAATTAPSQSTSHVAVDLGVSLSAPAGALGVTYGRRDWFLRAEMNPWLGLTTRPPIQPGTFNLAVGKQWLWAEGRVRSSIALGTSTLFFDTVLHERGRSGLCLQLVPLSWRKKLSGNKTLRLEPMSLHVTAPVLSGIPLILPQYRHSLGLEWRL